MLELMKTVLRNMSDDAQYFKKEFVKAKKWLSEDEFLELKHYLNSVLDNNLMLETEDVSTKK